MSEVVKLSGDRIATIKLRTARDLLEFQGRVQRIGEEDASLWLLIKSVDLPGEILTPENINQVLRVRDRITLDTAVFVTKGDPVPNDLGENLDDKSYFDSEDFNLPDGRRVIVLDPDGSMYGRYKRLVAKSYSKALAFAFQQMFRVSDREIDDLFLDTLAQDGGLGYDAATFLLAYWVNFFQPSRLQ